MNKDERLALADRITRESEYRAKALVTGDVYLRHIRTGEVLLISSEAEWEQVKRVNSRATEKDRPFKDDEGGVNGIRPFKDDEGGGCEWGGCDNPGVAMRRSESMWLPVCPYHLPDSYFRRIVIEAWEAGCNAGGASSDDIDAWRPESEQAHIDRRWGTIDGVRKTDLFGHKEVK